MSKTVRIEETGSGLWFHCPGCDLLHRVKIGPGWWSWNIDPDRPTVTPSLLSRTGSDKVCHLWIKGGYLEFLADCSHGLAGKKVEMAEIDGSLIA